MRDRIARLTPRLLRWLLLVLVLCASVRVAYVLSTPLVEAFYDRP